MNKKCYAIIAFCLLTISTSAQSMHYVRTAMQKVIPALSIVARFGTATSIGGLTLLGFGLTESDARRTEPATQEVTKFVHNVLVEHGIPQEEAHQIKVHDDFIRIGIRLCSSEGIIGLDEPQINAMGHASLFGQSYIIFPEYMISNKLKRKKKIDPTWKSTFIHEYSHIKNKDNLKEQALMLLSSFWVARGRAITIPLKLAITIGSKILHSKYAEYRADQEAIKRCSSETLYAEARNYVWRSEQTKNLFPHYLSMHLSKRYDSTDDKYWKKYNQLVERYETDLLYREYMYSKITGDWDHPSNLTRYNYFIAAAQEKEQQEKTQAQESHE